MKILVPALAFLCSTALAQTPSPAPSSVPRKASVDVDDLSDKDVQEALEAIRKSFLHADTLTQSTLDRATLRGLIAHLKPGILFQPRFEDMESAGPAAYPLHSEVIFGKIGYVRLSWLLKSDLAPLDAALADFSRQAIGAMILDLRSTKGQGDYEQAAEVLNRFCPKGRELFELKGGAAKSRIFTSNRDPLFQGILIVLVDGDNGGASEVIAAVLRQQAKAMIVGDQTSGRAVEYSLVEFADLTKSPFKTPLQIATAEVSIPQVAPIYPKGVTPDILVKTEGQVLYGKLDGKESVVPTITDNTVPRMSEHALVNGETPELDALQARQQGNGTQQAQPKDVVLQRAVDLITSINAIQHSNR